MAAEPMPDSFEKMPRAVVALGALRVIVTDGPRAAADAMQGQPTIAQTPPPLAAARVTGAGDAFLAAHLAAEMAGAARDAALTAAIAAASAHVTDTAHITNTAHAIDTPA